MFYLEEGGGGDDDEITRAWKFIAPIFLAG